MIRHFGAIFALLIAFAPSVRADVLLGEIPLGIGGGGDGVLTSSIQSIAFEFGYSSEIFGGICVVHRVGCEGMPIGDAQTGMTYSFTTANTQWFPEIAARLTNGTSEGMGFVNRLFDAAGTMVHGGGIGGVAEQEAFGTATDLTGNTITRITLTLEDFKLIDPDSFCGPPGVLCYKSDMVWRVYGTPNGTPAALTTWGRVKSSYR